ncbi:MAG: electron transfer flavoprotein subunit alpha [Actinobacteria bacterium]|nr:electron transfer flavoprotein subunit alpha [Actinomycetota bacterium]
MSLIKVNQEKCNGCGKCLKVCNYNAIKIEDKKANIDLYSCTFCNACIDACKFDAIKIIQSDRKIDSTEYKGIWVIVEYFNAELKNTSFQLISKAIELSKASGDEVTAVLIGGKTAGNEKLKRIFAEYGVKKIKLIVNDKLDRYIPEDFSVIISTEILVDKPKIVLFLGTIFGRSLAPRVATRIRTGLTADCTELQIDKDGNLLQIRPTYGGKILATIISPYNYPQMASVRPNVFIKKKEPLKDAGIDLTVKKTEARSVISAKELKKILKVISNTDGAQIPLDVAKIIFCAGLGVGSKEGFELVKDFARVNGAAIAATRAVVDNGWASVSEQIGQTGITVRPELYIGFGVSGAIHHIIGMRNSRKIVAINKDLRATIFKIADYCIVADLFDVIDKLKSNI